MNPALTLSASECDKSIRCFSYMIVGVFVSFFIVFLTAFALIPHLKAFLGSIDTGQQSFALGIRSAIIRIIGNFVGPIIFGVTIDSTCSFWKTNCYDQKVCKLYDNSSMSLSLSTIGFCVRFSTSLLTFIAYVLLRRSNKQIVNSGDEGATGESKKVDGERDNSNEKCEGSENLNAQPGELDSTVKVKDFVADELCESKVVFGEPDENEVNENPVDLVNSFQLHKSMSIPNEVESEPNVMSYGRFSVTASNAFLVGSTIEISKF
jgi:hypothetical protein